MTTKREETMSLIDDLDESFFDENKNDFYAGISDDLQCIEDDEDCNGEMIDKEEIEDLLFEKLEILIAEYDDENSMRRYRGW